MVQYTSRFRKLLLILILLSLSGCFGGTPDTPYLWTWISGSSGVDQAGVYGTEDIANPANIPGARFAGVTWRDGNNHLWLFGGNGIDSTASSGDLNDLWKFDGTNWTWVDGDKTVDSTGIYGTIRSPGPSNVPGARNSAVSWRDGSGNLWLFGGYGRDSSGTPGELNCLWKFNGTNWAWMSGSNSVAQQGNYGIKGTAAATNVPGAREGAVSWIDGSDNLWLFGGYGIDSAGTYGYLNDLWMFDGSDWTWISGSDTVGGATASYGVQGVADANNVPGGRSSATAWIDSYGDLWLFGGGGSALFNDLWKFDVSISQWIWVGGANTTNERGSYGTLQVASPSNVPGARQYAVAVIESNGHVWLFGGNGIDKAGTTGQLNDLWRFDGNNWAWISGSDVVSQKGIYGVKGTADVANTPGARQTAMTWINSYSEIWLFGGNGYDSVPTLGNLNDLWRFQP